MSLFTIFMNVAAAEFNKRVENTPKAFNLQVTTTGFSFYNNKVRERELISSRFPKKGLVREVLIASRTNLGEGDWIEAAKALAQTNTNGLNFFEQLAFFEENNSEEVVSLIETEVLDSKKITRLAPNSGKVFLKILEKNKLDAPSIDDALQHAIKEEEKAIAAEVEILKELGKKPKENKVKGASEVEKAIEKAQKNVEEAAEASKAADEKFQQEAMTAVKNLADTELQIMFQNLMNFGVKFDRSFYARFMGAVAKADVSEVAKAADSADKLKKFIEKELLEVYADFVVDVAEKNELVVPSKELVLEFLSLFDRKDLSGDFKGALMQFVSMKPKSKEVVFSFANFITELEAKKVAAEVVSEEKIANFITELEAKKVAAEVVSEEKTGDAANVEASVEVNSIASAAEHIDRQSKHRRGRETPLRRAN